MYGNKQNIGLVNGVKFKIINESTIDIYKPTNVTAEEFKDRCNRVVTYLIDEGLFKNKKCRVNIIQYK